MMSQSDRLMCEAMAKHGGVFAQALSRCMMCADRENFEILKKAFPDFVDRYTKIGDLMREVKSEKGCAPEWEVKR